MCRIVGFTDATPHPAYDREATGAAMLATLAHGGPDGSTYVMRDSLFLGHQHLAIHRATPHAVQPMTYGDTVLTFNGEIYNFETIRARLIRDGITFVSSTDTEVLLKALDRYGDDVLADLEGDFAFAAYNTRTKTLTLARDPAGVKPLYWSWIDGVFLFASELKALYEHPAFRATINKDAVRQYLTYGYIGAPRTIYNEVHKLRPGHRLTLTGDGDLRSKAYRRLTDTVPTDEPNAPDLDTALEKSVRTRLVGDVPIGVFLSGGVDSSLLTALAARHIPLTTFSLHFEDAAFDESAASTAIANHLKTDHVTLTCTREHVHELLPELPVIYDEPLGDASALLAILIARLAASHGIPCVLAGEGGDELFGGYPRYTFCKDTYPALARVPLSIRRAIRWGLSRLLSILPRTRLLAGTTIRRLDKGARALDATSEQSFFDALSTVTSHDVVNRLMPSPHKTARDKTTREKEPTKKSTGAALGQPIPRDGHLSALGAIDLAGYLPDDLLVKLDRATSHAAVEGRVPYLDTAIIRTALTLPDHAKVHKGSAKYPLKQLLAQHLPRALTQQRKQGFMLPLHDWIHTFLPNPLTLTADPTFADTFGLDHRELKKCVHGNNPELIWSLYVLFSWYETWKNVFQHADEPSDRYTRS
ncbi:MAG: asparagine synthase (glutamine-hydrolyzing) [Candidatus Paceibacterota bacterium]